jgi:hypothetical protein
MGFSPTMAIQYHLQTVEIAFWQISHLTVSLTLQILFYGVL